MINSAAASIQVQNMVRQPKNSSRHHPGRHRAGSQAERHDNCHHSETSRDNREAAARSERQAQTQTEWQVHGEIDVCKADSFGIRTGQQTSIRRHTHPTTPRTRSLSSAHLVTAAPADTAVKPRTEQPA